MVIYTDLHIHSCLSPCADADMTPMNICAMAKIKGLHAIAVTDHNSARNLAVIEKAAKEQELLLLPGMEITTREEVHLLAYFPCVENALAMGDFLYAHLPDVSNDPRIFGEQLVMDAEDAVAGVESRLLVSATGLSLTQTVKKIIALDGLPVPAHINRGNNGMLINLGFLPEDISFPALEVAQHLPVPQKIVKDKIVLHASDAHRLGNIAEAVHALEISAFSISGILNAIGYGHVRFI